MCDLLVARVHEQKASESNFVLTYLIILKKYFTYIFCRSTKKNFLTVFNFSMSHVVCRLSILSPQSIVSFSQHRVFVRGLSVSHTRVSREKCGKKKRKKKNRLDCTRARRCLQFIYVIEKQRMRKLFSLDEFESRKNIFKKSLIE